MIGMLIAALVMTHDPMPLPPFTFAGRITDYAHVAYDGDEPVEIRVYDEQGNLLSKGQTFTSGRTASNFIVNIPVADQAAMGCAVAGKTKVKIDFVDPDGQVFQGLVGEGDTTIGAPGEFKRLDIVLGTDADGDGIADEYVEALAYLMWKNKKSLYDAEADWDGDGAKNREEYVAGTNPFDATDKFSVRQMATDEGFEDYVKLTFLANQGRSYTVDTSEALEGEKVNWHGTVFKNAEGEAQTRINTGGAETGFKTIYVLKENLKQQFWKLKVE